MISFARIWIIESWIKKCNYYNYLKLSTQDDLVAMAEKKVIKIEVEAPGWSLVTVPVALLHYVFSNIQAENPSLTG